MKFNSQYALTTIVVCISTILVGLLIQALAKYLNRSAVVDNLVLASFVITIIVGFSVKGK